jgi:hypothetical protein
MLFCWKPNAFREDLYSDELLNTEFEPLFKLSRAERLQLLKTFGTVSSMKTQNYPLRRRSALNCADARNVLYSIRHQVGRGSAGEAAGTFAA